MSSSDPRLRLEEVPISAVAPASWNTRQGHDVDGIVESMAVNGVRQPVHVWASQAGKPLPQPWEIVAGEGRYLALQQLGREAVIVVPHDFATLADAKRWSIADNRLTDKSEWDLPALQDQLAELDSLAGTGFDDAEFEDLGGVGGGEVTEDEAPEPPEDPVTQPGDLYLLGEHRLLCGDATCAADVARVMDGERAGAVVTDPPYGINREGIANDDPAGLRGLFGLCLSAMPADDAIVIAFQSPRLFPVWMDALRDAGGVFERALWFYDETDVTFPWRGWLMTSQIALVSTIGTPKWPKVVDYRHDCYMVKTAGQQEGTGGHTTAKPLDVIASLVRNTSGLVYDPFLGSGTTLIAAEQLGRRCYGLEISERYVDVCLERWAKLTGREPILEATGETFTQRKEAVRDATS